MKNNLKCKININNFRNILRKATLNFTFDSVQIIFDSSGNMISKLTSNINNPITVINTVNNVLTDKEVIIPNGSFNMDGHDRIEFNFKDPFQTVMPYLNLIEDEYANIIIYDEKISLISNNQKSEIFYCSPRVVNIFGRESARDDITYFIQFPFTDKFFEDFNKIKKIGPRFGKIYFGVKKNKLFMETTDKQNVYSNSLKFHLGVNSDEDDLTICFDYRNIENMLTIIDDDYGNYELSLSFLRDKDMGLMYIHNNDESEKYYFMSVSENTPQSN